MESIAGGLFFAALGAFLLWMEKDQSIGLLTRLRIPRPDSQVVVYAGLGFLACGLWFAAGSPVPALFGAVLSAIGLAVTLRELWLLRDVRSWPAADAVVTSATVERGSGSGTINEDRNIGYATYTPVIRFVYDTPHGKVESWNGSFDGAPVYRDEQQAAQVVGEHPAGSKIAIRYCPEKPARTFTGGNPVPATKILLAAGFGGALVVLLAAILIK